MAEVPAAASPHAHHVAQEQMSWALRLASPGAHASSRPDSCGNTGSSMSSIVVAPRGPIKADPGGREAGARIELKLNRWANAC